MNKVITSKEELLKTAKSIVFEEGMDKLNIRYLAKKSNVSVGSVYNYFSSKSDLMIAVMEEFWRIIFHADICTMEEPIGFSDFFEKVYDRFRTSLEDFKSIFLKQMGNMNPQDSEKAKCLMDRYIGHISDGFLAVLEKDNKIPKNVWTQSFTKRDFIFFVVSNMMSMLTEGRKDCHYFKEVIERILYPQHV